MQVHGCENHFLVKYWITSVYGMYEKVTRDKYENVNFCFLHHENLILVNISLQN